MRRRTDAARARRRDTAPMLHPRVLVAEDDAELRELLVRGLRRHDLDATGVGTRAGLPGPVEIGRLRLDPVEHAVGVGDERIALTPTEFRLLAALGARPGEAV